MVPTLIAGNWKMNGLMGDLAEARAVVSGLAQAHDRATCLICPPATLVGAMADLARGTRLQVGAQTCHTAQSGAHTGDISARMLADLGASHVIVGHSERRADHGETDACVAAQAEAALAAGLTPIICIGETLEEREAGQTLDVVARQLAASLPERATPATVVIAYEPVWAIGTGQSATLEQVETVHASVRTLLEHQLGPAAGETPILYGGSMKPSNAAQLLELANVDGGLIGGASLKAADLLAIFGSVPE